MIPEEALNLLFWGMIASSAFTFLVSMPLYVLTIWTIARNLHKAPFDSQFFFIFIALGVADIGFVETNVNIYFSSFSISILMQKLIPSTTKSMLGGWAMIFSIHILFICKNHILFA
jgi:hypothetical protein